MKFVNYAYQKFDDSFMYLANEAVKSWNWATGKTKTDLANTMLTVAPFLESAGAMIQLPYLFSLPFSVMTFILTRDAKKYNRIQEYIEERDSNNGTVSFEQHLFDGGNRHFGPMFLSVSGASPILSLHPSFAIGGGLRGSSYYIMRADSPPPRKHVLARAKEKAAEYIASHQPAPAFSVSYSSKSLETMLDSL